MQCCLIENLSLICYETSKIMISYVANVINLLVTTLQSVFHIAWLTGKVIVSVLSGISSALLHIVENLILFFQIAYEDNVSIFTEDLPSITNDLLQAVSEQWSCLQNGVLMVYYDINFKICAIFSTVKWFMDALLLIISEVFLLCKSATLFVGDTIWLLLTFIPVHLPQLIKAVSRNLSDLIVDRVIDAYMNLLKITNFLTDVPLESFAGLTSAVVIIRLCIHFRETIQSQATNFYWALLRKLWYYYYAFYNYFLDSEMIEIARMSGGQELEINEARSAAVGVVDDGSGDGLCLICQERQKCVLTLPCRHVCLCTECCMRLYGYQRTCPICRTFIYHSVTVYL